MPFIIPVLLVLACIPSDQTPQDKPSASGPADEVVVTAARIEQPLTEAISLVTAIGEDDIARSPTLTVDDLLRSVPGFSLFRRSGSLVAHPTTQGVSLRGIGPSGAGRSLVLFDGIPMNDPVGGWVYWNRIPPSAIGKIEVVRGATSQLYGSSALGGTIQAFSLEPDGRRIRGRAQLGNAGLRDVDVTATDAGNKWSYLFSGRLFDSSGYYLVSEDIRGQVDVPASSAFQTFFGRLRYDSIEAGLNVFHESRSNGTRIQSNSTRMALFDVGVDKERWDARVYVQSELFESSFSRLLPDRSAEFLTALQEIPSTSLGASWTWQHSPLLVAGLDWRHARWDQHSQNFAGLFAQSLLPLASSLDLLLGARIDAWENERWQTSLNPRAGLIWRTGDLMTVRTSAYRGFRSPNLNELYRPFRVGNVETLENPALDEEYLWGGEAGLDVHPHRRLLIRVNGFWNQLDNAVTNVTLSTSPSQILRQRMNSGGIVAKGVESEAELEFDRFAIRGAYLLSDATLKGQRLAVPQVPRHQAVVALESRAVRVVEWSVQARWTDRQFEDDLNTMILPEYVIVDGLLSRPVSKRIRLFLAVENVFGTEYVVGRTPVEQLGAPRLVHGGLMFNFFQ